MKIAATVDSTIVSSSFEGLLPHSNSLSRPTVNYKRTWNKDETETTNTLGDKELSEDAAAGGHFYFSFPPALRHASDLLKMKFLKKVTHFDEGPPQYTPTWSRHPLKWWRHTLHIWSLSFFFLSWSRYGWVGRSIGLNFRRYLLLQQNVYFTFASSQNPSGNLHFQ